MIKQKSIIYNNTVQAMAQILRGMSQLNIPFADFNNEVCFFLLKKNFEYIYLIS